METIQVKSTKQQLEDFKESLVWADIVTELDSWAHGFNIELNGIVDDAARNNPSTANVLLHMGDLNGRQRAIEYFKALPDVLLQILNDRTKEVSNGNTD